MHAERPAGQSVQIVPSGGREGYRRSAAVDFEGSRIQQDVVPEVRSCVPLRRLSRNAPHVRVRLVLEDETAAPPARRLPHSLHNGQHSRARRAHVHCGEPAAAGQRARRASRTGLQTLVRRLERAHRRARARLLPRQISIHKGACAEYKFC